jgi:hypothetical protein
MNAASFAPALVTVLQASNFPPSVLPANPERKHAEVRFGTDSETFLCNSVLLLPNFISETECILLIEAADAGARNYEAQGHDASDHQGDAALTRVRVEDMHDAAKELSRSILQDRLLAYLEIELPDVADALFGQHDNLREMSCTYSAEEPCVNRYTQVLQDL